MTLGAVLLLGSCTTGDRPAGFDRIGVTLSAAGEPEILYFACSVETITTVSTVGAADSENAGTVRWRIAGNVAASGLSLFSPGSFPDEMTEEVAVNGATEYAELVAVVETTEDDHQVGFDLDELAVDRVHLIGNRDHTMRDFVGEAERSC